MSRIASGMALMAAVNNRFMSAITTHARVAAILPNQAAVYLLRLATLESGLAFAAINPLVSGPLLADALRRSAVTEVLVVADVAGARELRGLLPGCGCTCQSATSCGPR
jgi:hypothetical protein